MGFKGVETRRQRHERPPYAAAGRRRRRHISHFLQTGLLGISSIIASSSQPISSSLGPAGRPGPRPAAQFHTRSLVAVMRLDAPCNLSPDSSGPARPSAAAPQPPARHPTAAAAAAPGSWATAAP